MARIVVGVDGSKSSIEALRFAIEEARLRAAALEVVHAYSFPWVTALPIAPPPPTATELEIAAGELLAQAIDDAGGTGDVPVELTAVQAHPVEALLRAAEGADLLVVASRGLGGFGGSVLGSVSQQCVQHAPCPVTVVREQTRE